MQAEILLRYGSSALSYASNAADILAGLLLAAGFLSLGRGWRLVARAERRALGPALQAVQERAHQR